MKLTDRLKSIEANTATLEDKYTELIKVVWDSLKDGKIDQTEKKDIHKVGIQFLSELSSVIMITVALLTQSTTTGAIAGVLTWGTLWVIVQGPLAKSGVKAALLQEQGDRANEKRVWIEKEEDYKERLRQLEFDNWKLTETIKDLKKGE